MITITQSCDGCGAERRLKVGFYGQPREVRAAADQGGWRQVRVEAHLCPDCIAKAVRQ